jgi:hypothetical protein
MGVLALAGGIAAAAMYFMMRLHAWLAAQWFLVRLWRWFSGHTWHGKPVTDAGWVRRGQKVLTPTGHATRWHHLPRLHRAGWRTGGTAAAFGLIVGWLTVPLLTSLFVIFVVLVALALALWRVIWLLRARKHRKTWLHPLHLAAHELAGHPRALAAGSWITAETDDDRAVKRAELALPAGWPADAKDKERLVAIASAKLGIEAPEATWRNAGPTPKLTLVRSEPPPPLVTLDGVLEAIAAARRDEIVAGIGKRETIVKASLHNDSPHFGISMGSGGGKSNLAAFILLQELMRGAICLTLDAKWISHPWLIGLPNVAYCRTPAQIHAGLCWLSAELDRRNKVALHSVDAHGKIHANVGPRLFVIGEELNLCMPRLKAYWAASRGPGDPKESPAITGLGEIAFAGRQVRMHLLLIAQLLTAKATGIQGGEVRENIGVKFLARYSPSAWKMQAPEHPMAPKPTQIGRVQVVTAKGVAETQVPKLFDEDPALSEAQRMREMVLAGDVTPCPAGMPGIQLPVSPAPELESGASPAAETVSAPVTISPAPVLVTLAKAVERGNLRPDTTLSVLRNCRHRDPSFPERKGELGRDYLYDEAELIAYDARRGRS